MKETQRSNDTTLRELDTTIVVATKKEVKELEAIIPPTESTHIVEKRGAADVVREGMKCATNVEVIFAFTDTEKRIKAMHGLYTDLGKPEPIAVSFNYIEIDNIADMEMSAKVAWNPALEVVKEKNEEATPPLSEILKRAGITAIRDVHGQPLFMPYIEEGEKIGSKEVLDRYSAKVSSIEKRMREGRKPNEERETDAEKNVKRVQRMVRKCGYVRLGINDDRTENVVSFVNIANYLKAVTGISLPYKGTTQQKRSAFEAEAVAITEVNEERGHDYNIYYERIRSRVSDSEVAEWKEKLRSAGNEEACADKVAEEILKIATGGLSESGKSLPQAYSLRYTTDDEQQRKRADDHCCRALACIPWEMTARSKCEYYIGWLLNLGGNQKAGKSELCRVIGNMGKKDVRGAERGADEMTLSRYVDDRSFILHVRKTNPNVIEIPDPSRRNVDKNDVKSKITSGERRDTPKHSNDEIVARDRGKTIITYNGFDTILFDDDTGQSRLVEVPTEAVGEAEWNRYCEEYEAMVDRCKQAGEVPPDKRERYIDSEAIFQILSPIFPLSISYVELLDEWYPHDKEKKGRLAERVQKKIDEPLTDESVKVRHSMITDHYMTGAIDEMRDKAPNETRVAYGSRKDVRKVLGGTDKGFNTWRERMDYSEVKRYHNAIEGNGVKLPVGEGGKMERVIIFGMTESEYDRQKKAGTLRKYLEENAYLITGDDAYDGNGKIQFDK